MRRTAFVLGVFATLIMGGGITAYGGDEDLGDPSMYDYSDAPGYASTSHWIGYWQRLGEDLTVESGPLADDGDDGVWWSVDGGVTWGHEAIAIGHEVIFRFDVTRSGFGDHDYDQLKAWIDWNGDGYWDNEEEQLIALQWFKNTVEDGNTQIPDQEYQEYVNEYGVVPNPDAVLQKSFYVTVIVPEDAVIGETWLRARVTCWHTSFEDSNPYDHIEQGEVEDWEVEIYHNPEPATLMLMGLGIVGLVAGRIRRRR